MRFLEYIHVKTSDTIFEPRSEKTGLRGFRPGPTQTGQYSHTGTQKNILGPRAIEDA